MWCGCGDSVDFLEAKNKTEGECDITCPGNDGETCGGGASYNLYEVLESFDGECCTRGDGRGGKRDQSVLFFCPCWLTATDVFHRTVGQTVPAVDDFHVSARKVVESSRVDVTLSLWREAPTDGMQ